MALYKFYCIVLCCINPSGENTVARLNSVITANIVGYAWLRFNWCTFGIYMICGRRRRLSLW